jgi:hypothetical protein
MGVEKRHVARGGKISFSEGGGGINIVFGPKYRPLSENITFPKGFLFNSRKMQSAQIREAIEKFKNLKRS